jgi:D-xylose 1-dehydrogenase (NADP+, D-xylono-1,5-lactone-forming)
MEDGETKKRSLSWGILSTARIKRAVIPPIKASPRNVLGGIASRSIEKAKTEARAWGIPRYYGSYEELLADPEIDVIYNPLPNSMHAEWTIQACQAGKHVLCEKPLAVTLDEVKAIEEAANQAGVIVAEAFMYRHHMQTLRVKELVDGGSIGEPKLVRGAFSFTISNPADVRLSADLAGGSVWDIGCYPISYARAVLGREPSEVFGWQVTGEGGVDEYFSGQLRFPGEVVLQFDSSFRVPDRAFMEFVGTEGVLFISNPFKPRKRETLLLNRAGKVQKIPVKSPELYLGEIEDMADAILSGKQPRITLTDSYNNVAVIKALLTSAQQNQPVSLKI